MTPGRWPKWRRWLWRLALVAIAARVLLALFLAPLLGLAAGFAGLTLTMRGASLSLLGTSLRLEDVVVRAAGDGDGPPLFVAEDIVVDLSSRRLLGGEIGIVDAAVSGARITLQRRPDGSFVLPAAWAANPIGTPPAADDPDAPATVDGRGFALPLHVASARLHDCRLAVFDVGSERAAIDITLDARAVDIGRHDRPGRIEVRAQSPAWLDRFTFDAELLATPTTLHANWRGAVRGVPPSSLPLPPAVAAALRATQWLGLDVRGEVRGELGDDHRTRLRGDLQLAVDGDDVDPLRLSCSLGPTTAAPGGDGTRSSFALELTARGLVQRLALHGELDHGANGTAARGAFACERATLAWFTAELAAAGLTLPVDGLTARGEFDLEVADGLSASLRDVEIRGGEQQAALAHAAVSDLRATAAGLVVGAITLRGPELALRRSADGALTFAGVRLQPPTTAAAAAEPAPSPTPVSMPRLRVGSLRWNGASLAYTDDARPSGSTLQLTDVDVAIAGLTLGAAAPPARLQARARLVGILDPLQLDATLTPTTDGLHVTADLRGHGITTTGLAPWLPAVANAVSLRDGSLAATAEATLTFARNGACRAAVTDLSLRDDDAILVALDALHAEFPSLADPERWLGPTTLRGLRVRLVDDVAAPLALALDVDVGRIAPDRPFTTRLSAQVAGAVDAATARIDAVLGASPHASLDLTASGLRGTGLSRVLPASLRSDFVDGSLSVRADAAAGTGGSADLRVHELRIADRTRDLLALARAEFRLAAADADAVHVTTCAVLGLRASIELADDGTHVAGLVVPPATAANPLPPTTTAAPPPPLRLPMLRIDGVTLQVERGELRDLRGGAGDPVVFDGTLTMAPWQASGDPDAPGVASVTLDGKALPLVRSFLLRADLVPFALAPTAVASWRTELDPTAVSRVLPSLASTLGGTTERLEVLGGVEARLDLRRRDPRVFDFGRPFGGEIVVHDLLVQRADDRHPLGAVRSIDATIRAFDPRTGDVLLRSLDVADVVLPIERTTAGLELLGLRLLPAVATPGPPAAPPAAGDAPIPEFAIDHLEVGGLQVSYRDATTEPPTVLPIDDLDFTLTRFGTRTFTEPRPFAFELSARGGMTPLERRIVRSSLFAGMIGSTVAAVGFGADAHETEHRPLVEELAVRGNLQCFPHLRGQLHAAVTAFELPALRGLAKPAGVDIADGLADHTLALDLRGPDGITGKATTVFTWLSLSEPPGGPISTYLRLPAPLDSVLYLLRNDADEQRLPLELRIPGDERAATAVRELAAESVLRLLAGAVGGAAGRAAGALTGALGLGGSGPEVTPAVVTFAAGSSAPTSLELAAIANALTGDPQTEAVLVHELAAADLAVVATATSPPPAEVTAWAERLRARRTELTAAREPLAAAVDAHYAAGRTQEAQAQQRALAANDAALGELEATLRQALGMLDTDRPRAAERRRAAAAKALGAARQAEVEAALLAAAPGLRADRLVWRAPRAVAVEGLAAGGQVVVTVRRRVAR